MSNPMVVANKHTSASQPFNTAKEATCVGKLFPIEAFIDISNIDTSLRQLGHFHADYGVLMDAAVQRFTENLGITFVRKAPIAKQLAKTTGQTMAFLRRVWGVASVPVNYHREDIIRVKKYFGFLRALRLRHGFSIKEVPMNFHGYHLRQKDRSNSDIEAERMWQRREKCVDVTLAMFLLKRCTSSDAPAGIMLWTGDADLSVALNEIIKNNPQIRATVVGFANTMSAVYISRKVMGYTWPFPPILLDACLAEPTGFMTSA
jgi:hypothetical protein